MWPWLLAAQPAHWPLPCPPAPWPGHSLSPTSTTPALAPSPAWPRPVTLAPCPIPSQLPPVTFTRVAASWGAVPWALGLPQPPGARNRGRSSSGRQRTAGAMASLCPGGAQGGTQRCPGASGALWSVTFSAAGPWGWDAAGGGHGVATLPPAGIGVLRWMRGPQGPAWPLPRRPHFRASPQGCRARQAVNSLAAARGRLPAHGSQVARPARLGALGACRCLGLGLGWGLVARARCCQGTGFPGWLLGGLLPWELAALGWLHWGLVSRGAVPRSSC